MEAVTQYSVTEDVALITLRNAPADMAFISRVFKEIADRGINVDMISQTAPIGGKASLSFTVSDESLGDIFEIFARIRKGYPTIKTDISGGNCKISFSGDQMRTQPGVAARVFEEISRLNVDVTIITTSEIDISILIPKADFQSASHAFEGAFQNDPVN